MLKTEREQFEKLILAHGIVESIKDLRRDLLRITKALDWQLSCLDDLNLGSKEPAYGWGNPRPKIAEVSISVDSPELTNGSAH